MWFLQRRTTTADTQNRIFDIGQGDPRAG